MAPLATDFEETFVAVAESELAPWPTELRVRPERDRVAITWDDGATHDLPAELLRVLTPSAERKGHGGTRTVIGGKATVTIAAIHPVGRYAVRIAFSDGHDSGLYTFPALREMGERQEVMWREYLAEIGAAGLSRERPGTAPAPRGS